MPKILVTYGSQTGNGESIANILYKKLDILDKKIDCLNNVIGKLKEYKIVIIILSATGDGEFPDNANLFWKSMKKRKDKLDIDYVMLGLGDSNYRSYCHTSKCLRRKLNKLECLELVPVTYIDDAIDDTDKITEWIDTIVQLIKIMKSKEKNNYIIDLVNYGKKFI